MKKKIYALIILSIVSCSYSCGAKNNESLSSSESTASSPVVTEEITTAESATETSVKTSDSETTTQNTTEIETEALTKESTDANISSDLSTDKIVEIIGNQFDITDVTKMAAEMIGAEEGTSFKYNDSKYEIYRFSNDNPKLIEAQTGLLTFEIEGFGSFTSDCVINNNFVMTYKVQDDSVISAFINIK